MKMFKKNRQKKLLLGTCIVISLILVTFLRVAYAAETTTAPTTTPTISTLAATSISTTSATLTGNITSDGGASVTGRGIVYSTTDTSPTIGEAGITQDSNGTGTGMFSESISSLSTSTTYYFRAYAINSEGTVYGGVRSFTTLTPPVITIDNTTLAYTENDAATQIDATGTLNDMDGDADWNGGKLEVQIIANAEAADEISIPDNVVGTINTSGINILNGATTIGTLSANEGTVTNGTKLTITFNASATNALVQQVLQAIHYRNTSDDPGTSNRTVTFTATDKNAAVASNTRTIQVTAVNDEPALTATASDPTFTEGGSAAGLFTSTSVSTVESGQRVSDFTMTVTNVNDGVSEILNVDGTSITLTHGTTGTTAASSLIYSVSLSGTTATVSISGGALSPASFQALINAISYQNNSNTPNISNRVVKITSMKDSGGTANGGDDTVALFITSTVSVAENNDEPTLTATGTNPTFTEDGSAVSLFSNASVSTVESGQTLLEFTMTVTNVNNGSNERLKVDGSEIILTHGTTGTTASNSLNYSVSLAGGTATVSFRGTLSTSSFQTLINAVSYKNNSNTPNTSNRVVMITSIKDSGGTANGGDDTAALSITSTVTVAENNDEPTLSATGTNPTFTEDGSAVSLFSNASVSTVESGQILSDFTMTVTNVSDGVSEILNVDGTSITLTHGTTGTTAGSSLNYSVSLSGTTATVSLSGGALSCASFQSLINAVAYQNNSNTPNISNRVVTITSMKDSGGTANSGDDTAALCITSLVTVVAINDLPTLTSFASPVETTTENTEIEITLANLKAQGNEVDVDGTVDAFIVKALSTGTLNIGANSGTATAFNATTNKTINATNNAYWTPANNASGTINAFTTTVLDNNGAESTGAVQATVSVVPSVTLALSTPTITEASGTSTITATLSAVSSQNVTVIIAVNGSSTADASDYSLSSTSIVINAGSVIGTAILTATQDRKDENDETVIIDITGVTGGIEAGVQQKTVTITDDDVAPTSGNDSTPTTQVIVEVNGEKQESFAQAQTKTENGHRVTIVKINEKKLEEKLKKEGQNAKVTILVTNQQGTVKGQLSGEMIKNMENKEAIIEIETEKATYTLPARQIKIDEISEALGTKVDLEDIQVEIEIGETPKAMVKVVENTASKDDFTLVVPPVNFTVKCSYGNKTVEIKKFSSYVERTIAIPDGVKPDKITTGIIVYPDGTICHVPTQIIQVDGKYYAKINSLTNSTYSVIWNPKEYSDVENHWAKDVCNEMGSRMIVEEETEKVFNPNQELTRLFFTQTVVRALGLGEKGTEGTFKDLDKTKDYFGAVATAVENDLIKGYKDNTFRADNKITRQEAAALIMRAMKIAGLKTDYTEAELANELNKFIDNDSIDIWAKEYIAICSKQGLIVGNEKNEFLAKDNITKAELATIIKRMLEKAELI